MADLVRDHMTTNVVSVPPLHPVKAVLELFEAHRIRHVPVVDDAGTLHGLVSKRDVMARAVGPMSWLSDRESDEALTAMGAREVMTDEVTTIAPDASFADAAQLLLDKQFSCLPVVDDGSLVGILTEADFVKAWAAKR